MRDQHNRDILFYDVRISSDPATRRIVKMRELCAFIDANKNGQDTVYVTRNGAKKITVLDASVDHNYNVVKFLIRINNLHGSHASFAHWSTGKHRVEEKKEGEGRPETSHIIVSLAEDGENSNRYVVLLEASSLLSRHLFQVYLNAMMRAFRRSDKKRFTMPDPNGSKENGKDKIVKFKCKLHVAGHLSTEVMESLRAGGLRGAFFETDKKKNMGFGEGAFISPVRKQIKLQVGSEIRTQAVPFLKRACSVGRTNGYEHLRISFDAGDRTAQVLFDTETQELASEGFIKKESLHATDISLPESSTELESILIERMISLLVIHRGSEVS